MRGRILGRGLNKTGITRYKIELGWIEEVQTM